MKNFEVQFERAAVQVKTIRVCAVDEFEAGSLARAELERQASDYMDRRIKQHTNKILTDAESRWALMDIEEL